MFKARRIRDFFCAKLILLFHCHRMTLMRRTRAETLEALNEQLRFIRHSSTGYDSGELIEAKRLATAAYAIVHDGKRRTKSILTQLGVLEDIRFLASSRPINPRNLLSEASLVLTRIGFKDAVPIAEYVPRVDAIPEEHRYLAFHDWWNEPIFRDTLKLTLSRKELVSSLRDQDNGAHFDEELRNPVYIGLSKNSTTGFVVFLGNGEATSINPAPHLASMRQIAHEIEKTLSSQGSKVILS